VFWLAVFAMKILQRPQLAAFPLAIICLAVIAPALAASKSVPPDAVLGRMFAVPGLAENPDEIDFVALPALKGTTSVVFRGVPNESAFMHHPKIAFFNGQFFAKWNDGYVGEDLAGQRVRYATSPDGVKWSEPMDLTGRHPKRRYTACGFWLRDREVYALAALRDASDAGSSGEEPVLLAFKYDPKTRRFGERTVIAKNFFAGNVPQKTPDGDWLILGKGGVGSWGPMKAAKGGVKAIDDWTIRDLPGAGKLEEAEWYTLPNGDLVSHFRTRPTKRLMRSYSIDNGVTWSEPVVTNFPEQGARHHGLKLSNGTYALLVNPNPAGRIPFSIALSKDGLLYDRIGNVRAEPTKARAVGRAKSPGYHYMRGFEHQGKLYTIYSVNKEDIEVTIVPLSELMALYR
jgi:hypothetical protein